MEETLNTLPEVEVSKDENANFKIDGESENTAGENAQTDTLSNSQSEQANDDFLLDIKYNKEHFSLNREDAVKYAQMGKKYEDTKPLLEKLQLLASYEGKTAKDFLNETLQNLDESRLEHFKEIAEDDEEIFDALVQADGIRLENFDIEQSQADLEREQIQTLSKEFLELKNNIPEFEDKQFDAIDDEVLITRDKNGISLLDAYLRCEYKNATLKKQLADKTEQNKMASVGAVTNDGYGSNNNSIGELVKGIWG